MCRGKEEDMMTSYTAACDRVTIVSRETATQGITIAKDDVIGDEIQPIAVHGVRLLCTQ